VAVALVGEGVGSGVSVIATGLSGGSVGWASGCDWGVLGMSVATSPTTRAATMSRLSTSHNVLDRDRRERRELLATLSPLSDR